MKRLKLLLFAVSPFLLGYLLNYVLMTYWSGSLMLLASVLFSVYWFFVGYKSSDYAKTVTESLLIGNSFALVSFILVEYQLIAFGDFLFSILGRAPQMFYLPLLDFSVRMGNILFFIPSKFVNSTQFMFILSFIIMVIIYYIGYSVRVKGKKKK